MAQEDKLFHANQLLFLSHLDLLHTILLRADVISQAISASFELRHTSYITPFQMYLSNLWLGRVLGLLYYQYLSAVLKQGLFLFRIPCRFISQSLGFQIRHYISPKKIIDETIKSLYIPLQKYDHHISNIYIHASLKHCYHLLTLCVLLPSIVLENTLSLSYRHHRQFSNQIYICL